jgi:hypothetical protein
MFDSYRAKLRNTLTSLISFQRQEKSMRNESKGVHLSKAELMALPLEELVELVGYHSKITKSETKDKL